MKGFGAMIRSEASVEHGRKIGSRHRDGEPEDTAPAQLGRAECGAVSAVLCQGDWRWSINGLAIDQKSLGGREIASSTDREQASHTSSARAGRTRQSQSKWAGPRVVCTRTALVTAPFLVCHLRCAVSLPPRQPQTGFCPSRRSSLNDIAPTAIASKVTPSLMPYSAAN